MELMAALEAVRKCISMNLEVVIVTDSQYLQRGMTEWMPKWKSRGWKTAGKKPVQNADLWRELDSLSQQLKVSWSWVAGHSGVAGNELADRVANQAYELGVVDEVVTRQLSNCS
jgi:ribonuclease HI